MECPISEDVESVFDRPLYHESEVDSFSDYSSSSTFSLQKKKMSFDLSRLIDDSEPQFDDASSFLSGGRMYFGNVNDTI